MEGSSKSSSSNYKQMGDGSKLEAENLRTIAFCGVALSTIATLICVVTVPMFYNYMQHLQSNMISELDFCKMRSSNIWREVTRTQVHIQSNISNHKQVDLRYYPLAIHVLHVKLVMDHRQQGLGEVLETLAERTGVMLPYKHLGVEALVVDVEFRHQV